MPSRDRRPDGADPSPHPPSPHPTSRWLSSRRLLAAVVAALVAGGGLIATACLAPSAVAAGPSATPPGRAATPSNPAADDPDGETETDLTARAAAPVPAADAERQAQLVQGEDDRLLDVRIAGNARQVTYPLRPYRVRSSGFYTLVLTQRRAAYTLDDLRRLAPQTFLPQRDGSFLLREHILVDTGATLALAPERPTTIKLFSGPNGFVSIVSRGGRLRLLGTAAAPLTFTSWDETANRPDTTLRDGRAYLLAQGQLIVRHSTFADLGFWSGRTGGLAIEGAGAPTAGANLSTDTPAPANGASSTHRQAQVLPAGVLPATAKSNEVIAAEVSDSLMDGNTFGLFVTGTSGLTIRNVVIRNSLVHGLVLHRSVTTARVDQVRVERSAGSGVVVTRGVEGVTFSQITSSGNALDGFVITGTPLATGPSPSGGSVRQFGNNVLSASVIENSGRTGIRINGGTSVRLIGNSITGGHQGILVTHGAAAVVIEANRVVGASANGIQVRNAAGVEVTGNSVREAPTGIHLSDSVAKIGDNTVASATLHAVSLVGTVAGTIVRGNTLSGSGSSAVDVSRVTTGKIPDIRVNDTGGWQRVITKDGALSTVMHPLTLVWIAIALLIIGSRPIARRARRAPQVPYLETPTRSEATTGISHEQRVAIEAILALEGHAAGWEDVQHAPAPAGWEDVQHAAGWEDVQHAPAPAVPPAAPMRRVTTPPAPMPAAVAGPGHPGRHPGQAHPTGPGRPPERRGPRVRPALSSPITAEFALPNPAGHGRAAPQYLDLREDVQPSVGWGPDDPAGESPNADWLRQMGLSQ